MRNEKEMFDLIIGVAKQDLRIKAVYMNGSRANPNAPKDIFQDYDIVYVVENFKSFVESKEWIDVFGKRLMLQTPETMREPSGAGHFNWMMLFDDSNRLDLTLIPIEKPELIGNDSLTVTLLDKDGILPYFPKANDSDYVIQPPTKLFYDSCCNNYWWCLQNVAKGIVRDELPYGMMMLNSVVREELHDMISWYIGTITDFGVSSGKMGKYFKKYLPPELYEQYLKTYSEANHESMWKSLLEAEKLFSYLSVRVANHLKYEHNKQDEENMEKYIASLTGKTSVKI